METELLGTRRAQMTWNHTYTAARAIALSVPSACPAGDLGSTRQLCSLWPSRFLRLDFDKSTFDSQFLLLSNLFLLLNILIQPFVDTLRRTISPRLSMYLSPSRL